MPYEKLNAEVERLEKGLCELEKILIKMPPAATDGENGKSQTKDTERITQMQEKRKITQCQKILLYLERNGGATVRDIFIDCNINSPTKRLSELRKDGFITEKKWDGENFKRYYLRGESA